MNKRQLTRINIKGFKSIKDCTVDLGMINVLIGSNGAGKTNFLSLFTLLQNVIDGMLQTYVSKQGGPNALLYFGSKITEEMALEFYFGENGYGMSLIPAQDNRMIFADEWFFWALSGRHSIGKGHFESKWKNGCNSRIDSYIQPIFLKHKWRIYHFHDTSDTAYVKQYQGINDNIELATDGRNLAAFLYRLLMKHKDAYNRIISTIRLAAPYFDDFILRPNPLQPETIQLEWKNYGYDIPLHASQLSDGTLRFMCLATLLLQPASLLPETIIIDEPELGLHPFAISLLGEMIRSLSNEQVSKPKQIILSTQSVALLNEFSIDQVIVVDRDDNQSVFHRLDEEELTIWLKNDYALGEMWEKNLLGGRPSK